MQEPRGEERCWRSVDLFASVDGWVGGGGGSGREGGGLFCTNKVFSKSKQRCNNKKIRPVTSGSTAVCQILMAEVHAVN